MSSVVFERCNEYAQEWIKYDCPEAAAARTFRASVGDTQTGRRLHCGCPSEHELRHAATSSWDKFRPCPCSKVVGFVIDVNRT